MKDGITLLQDDINASLTELLSGREPKELYEPMRYVLEAGGKRIRPILVLLSCEAVGGDVEQVWPAALAVEILHTFTLVHDDIMDHDAMRRGSPTIHTRWDEATAILAGDGLVTLAYQVLLGIHDKRIADAARLFTDGLLILCEGQAMDKSFETRKDVSLTEYMIMIQKKTGKLLEVACDLGAVLGGAGESERLNLKAYANAWGEGFQIQDDLLDIYGEESKLGKPACSDIQARKQTFLSLHFYEHAGRAEINAMRKYWGSKNLSNSDITHIRELMSKTGSLESARNAVYERTEAAQVHLESLPKSRARKELLGLVNRLRERSY
ncbi:polyprenyl synthetase family protein [bacterium]|nr:polyprenyl synthetase family protein [bacterium]